MEITVRHHNLITETLADCDMNARVALSDLIFAIYNSFELDEILVMLNNLGIDGLKPITEEFILAMYTERL